MASKGLTALATGGLSLLGGGEDDAMEDMIRLIRQNTAAAEKDYQPYLGGGQSAQEQLMAQLGIGGTAKLFDVTQLPGYQNALKQGLSSVNQGAAGSGMLMSGDRLKGLQSAGQNIFGNYYNDYLSRLFGMSNQGFSAAGNLANIRTGGMTQQLGLMQQQQAQEADMMSDMLGLAGTVGGMMVGGPVGAGIGGSVGGMMSGGGKSPAQSSFGPFSSGYKF